MAVIDGMEIMLQVQLQGLGKRQPGCWPREEHMSYLQFAM